jgi:hypothetical protein
MEVDKGYDTVSVVDAKFEERLHVDLGGEQVEQLLFSNGQREVGEIQICLLEKKDEGDQVMCGAVWRSR